VKTPPARLDLSRYDPEEALRKIERIRCEDSLLEFFKRAWREIPEVSNRPLSINWHHSVIIEHWESIVRGEIRNLIENIPPRHTKTLLNSVIAPSWVWCRSEIGPLSGPQVKFLCVSYGAELSEEIGLKMLRLVQSDWYQGHWGDRVKILQDQKSRANFGNSAGGERMSTSISGGVLGRGGDAIIIDDPQTRKGADSELERRESLRGMSDLVTRIADPRTSVFLLVMHRLHVNDATDWALKNWPADTVHLMFPARFDPSRACESDPRRHEGELLWPEVWTEEELRKIELGLAGFEDGDDGLSDYAISGQLQQAPIPKKGGIISHADWMTYPEVAPRAEDVRRLPDGRAEVKLPDLSYVVLALDTAMSEKETADWNACTVMGVWHRRRNVTGQVNPFAGRWAGGRMDPQEARERIIEDDEQPRAILMEAWRRRGKLNDDTPDRFGKAQGLVQRVIETARRRKVDRIIIENKTRGKDVADEIRRQMRGEEFLIEMFEPGRHGDKVARLHSVQPMFSQGLVYKPANLIIAQDRWGREYVDIQDFIWVDTVLTEVNEAPNGRHDDLADCLSMSCIFLRENGFLQLTKEFVEDSLRQRAWRPQREDVRERYGV